MAIVRTRSLLSESEDGKEKKSDEIQSLRLDEIFVKCYASVYRNLFEVVENPPDGRSPAVVGSTVESRAFFAARRPIQESKRSAPQH
jgi:hypothetical protein